MVTFLITAFLVFGLFAIAMYLWQKPAKNFETTELQPSVQPRSLFADIQAVHELDGPEIDSDMEQRQLLIARSSAGDISALQDAQKLEETDLYNQILDVLMAQVDSHAKLLSLVAHVMGHELPVNDALATAVIKSWEASADRNSTARMLHISALSDNAEIYGKAVEVALRFWREGKSLGLSPIELQALFTSEFWVLSAGTRSSGAGFILKQTLSSARRELERSANN
jgi:hypothetical protein